MDPQKKEDQEITLDQEEFEELHEKFGSAHFKLQGEILKDFGSKKLDLYFKSIGFTTSVTGVIGIIAGFGFTALGYIQSPFLFFIGEGLLLGALFHGVWWVQKIYAGEFKSLNADMKKFREFFDIRNAKYMELYNKWMTKKSISRKAFTELNDIDKNSINLFKTDDGETPKVYSKTTYFLGISGAALLLGSFFIFSFLNILYKICIITILR